MLALFQRKPTAAAPTAPEHIPEKDKGLLRPASAATLLAAPRRQRLLEHIWQRTSLSRRQFKTLYLAPLERYAELVQQFPASESHHHAYPGGMLDHGLQIVAYALKLRQSYLLPIGSTPEDQAAQAEVWTAATAYAALIHDIGKIAVDLHVELADDSTWHPWHGPLQHAYRFRYRAEREYRLHSAAAGLLYTRILDRQILDWLSGYPELWSALLYVLAGQYEHAGTLGELVVKADQASVAQALGGDPAKAMAAPKHALQRKLLEGLRYLLHEELKINQPQASDGWLTEDALWLVSKTVSDKLRAHLLSQGIEGIPANNTAVFNVLQDHGIAQPTPDGKAIWKATVTSNAGWSNSFTFLRLSPALVWEAGERPDAFAGTVKVEAGADDDGIEAVKAPPIVPTVVPEDAPRTEPMQQTDAIADLLSMFETPEPASAIEPLPVTEAVISAEPLSPASSPRPNAATPSGEHFITWLRQGIQSRKLIINDAKALVHTVAGTAYLVSPGVFQRYVQEHPQVAALAQQNKVQDWQWVQKRFEKQGLHRKQDSGLNIWSCSVTGPRKTHRLHGYLMADPLVLFTELPPDNPHLALGDSPPNSSPIAGSLG